MSLRSQSQRSLTTETPIDSSIMTHDAGDMATELLLQRWRPRHQTEPEAVIDHGEATGGEVEASCVSSGHMLAGGRWLVWHPAFACECGAHGDAFTPMQGASRPPASTTRQV